MKIMHTKALHLAANRLWQTEAGMNQSGNVVDATARFEEGNGLNAILNYQGTLLNEY